MTHFISNSLILIYKWTPPNSSASHLTQQIDYVYEQSKEKDDEEEFENDEDKTPYQILMEDLVEKGVLFANSIM